MSSVDDQSCGKTSSELSCEAMRELAKKEFAQNQTTLLYSIDYPACVRHQQLADRSAEHTLQKSGGLSKNLCFTPDQRQQSGPWEEQFAPLRAVPESFLISTKQRFNTPTA